MIHVWVYTCICSVYNVLTNNNVKKVSFCLYKEEKAPHYQTYAIWHFPQFWPEYVFTQALCYRQHVTW